MIRDEIIHLGNGFIYVDGSIKESVSVDSMSNKEWLSHEECRKWVADSLKKIYKFGYMERNDDPFFRYTDEERMNMTREEYCALIEERNEYVRKKFDQSKGAEAPRFNTIEEFRAYYNCIPFEEAVKNMNKLFDEYDEPEFHNESDREQEEFIEQCRRELEARVEELRQKRQQ